MHERAAGGLDDQCKRGGCALNRLASLVGAGGSPDQPWGRAWAWDMARRFLRVCPLFVQPTEIKPGGAVGGAAGADSPPYVSKEGLTN